MWGTHWDRDFSLEEEELRRSVSVSCEVIQPTEAFFFLDEVFIIFYILFLYQIADSTISLHLLKVKGKRRRKRKETT